MKKRATNDWETAKAEANNLHAHLSKHHPPRFAAYATTTAYAWFCMRDNHNKMTVQQYEAAQERVETHLREPSGPFDVPTDDIICQYAKSAREQLGNPIWARM